MRLKAGVLLNFETKSNYSVTVSVDDPTVGTLIDASVVYTLTITNANENPTSIQLSASSVIERTDTNTVVGTLTATDPDSGDSLTFSLSDAAQGRFKVVGNVLMVDNGQLLNVARDRPIAS